MTRKRFVKLLMAEGYSRNKACKIAADAWRNGLTYSSAYKAEQGFLAAKINLEKINLEKINVDAMCDAIRQIVDVATKVALAISKAVGAFAEAYRAEMEAVNNE